MRQPKVQVRRVYQERRPGDGAWVLVDRIWPRGLTKAKADLDGWCLHVAPSAERQPPQAFVHALFLESSIRLARPASDPSAQIRP